MITGRTSILSEVMEKNGVTKESLAEKLYGDSQKVQGIELMLEIRERSPKKVEEAINAAGGTSDDIARAKAELKAYQPIVKELDEARNAAVAKAIADAHAEHDVYATDAWNKVHAQGAELLAKEKEEAEKKKAAKKEKTETVLEPASVVESTTEAPVVDDPFNE